MREIKYEAEGRSILSLVIGSELVYGVCMNEKNILDYFPLDSEPRPKQVEALEWLATQKAKYLLLEAPVGVGKSAIGICFSRWLKDERGSSFILTPQRILQEQYERSFDASLIASLYGKGNYECRSKNTTCDIGSLVKPRCDSCPFSMAVGRAKSSPNTVFNYKLALLLFAFTPVFTEKDKRRVMILDECHTVEEHLVEFNAVSVSKKRCDKFGVEFPDLSQHNLLSARDWVKQTYLPKAEEALTSMFHEVEPLLDKGGNELSRSEIKKIREYSSLEDHIDELMEFGLIMNSQLEREYVLTFDKMMLKFKQVTGARNFHEILKPQADQFLFMSSTILNKEGFCADLGLPPEETAFLSLDSEFPVENRHVLYSPVMKMNASWRNQDDEKEIERQNMLTKIRDIAAFHEGESGIIHTANFAISKWLVEQLDGTIEHQIIHHNPDSGDDRNAVIRQFTGLKKPSILISPSITEGLDLHGDLARFAIFAKVPFGYMGDQWIKRRMQMSKEWYQRRALIDIIQGGGRVVRSKDDWGVVYILDESWGYLYNQTRNRIPQWWKDAYKPI